MKEEKRQHRRLAIGLPLEYYPKHLGKERALRTVTRNISTGGLYFEADLLDSAPAPEVNSLLKVELTVPPGDGYFPYEGRVTSVAEVLRCEALPHAQPGWAGGTPRVGVAARFREPLRLAF